MTNTPENLRKVERLIMELDFAPGAGAGPSYRRSQVDYRNNAKRAKAALQNAAFENWNQKRRSSSKGVKAKNAY